MLVFFFNLYFWIFSNISPLNVNVLVHKIITPLKTYWYLVHPSSDAFCKSIEGEILVLRSGAEPTGKGGRTQNISFALFILYLSFVFYICLLYFVFVFCLWEETVARRIFHSLLFILYLSFVFVFYICLLYLSSVFVFCLWEGTAARRVFLLLLFIFCIPIFRAKTIILQRPLQYSQNMMSGQFCTLAIFQGCLSLKILFAPDFVNFH